MKQEQKEDYIALIVGAAAGTVSGCLKPGAQPNWQLLSSHVNDYLSMYGEYLLEQKRKNTKQGNRALPAPKARRSKSGSEG